jgi:cysteine-rich repeat protein
MKTATIAETIIPNANWYYGTSYAGGASFNVTSSWAIGYKLDNPTTPTAWVEDWGDGKRIGSEKWDDGNTSNGDGCSNTCIIETSWVCAGGSPTSQDTCTEWTFGFYVNDASNPTACLTQCGDGLKAGTEKCDDGNTSNGDGWKNDCSAVEIGWVWSGGSITSVDICTFWTSGFYVNDVANPILCVTQCGDGLKAGTEKCDDGNTSNGDGWKSDWTSVEAGWVWSGGSTILADTWTQWSAGYYQNDAINPTFWITQWGDGLEVGSEKCDDGNTSDGDGCKGDCTTVESGWVWYGGSSATADTWTFWTSGFYQNDSTNPTTWVPYCGDGLEVGSEKCDDGNTNDGDGCKGDCTTVESGWVWSGGSSATADIWTFCTSGFYQNDATNPILWVPHCGDGLEVGSEKCDDGNVIDGDGWKGDCTTVEAGWVWSGGSSTSADFCTFCTSGYYQNDPINPTVWVTHWGDGLRVGSELCDDGNTSPGDGCGSTCLTIDSNWVWNGGSSSSADTCVQWTTGYEPNNSSEPRYWIEIWGDGRRVGNEAWDDGNKIEGDGWSSTCFSIQSGWIWNGGSLTSKDNWTEWPVGYSNNADNTACVPGEISQEIKTAKTLMTSVLGAGIGLNLATALLGGASPQASLNMVNSIQLLLLLPLIGAYIPRNIIDFIRGMNFSLFDFDFLSLEGNPETKEEVSNLSFEQDNPYLYLIGLESGSWMVNLLAITGLFSVIPLVHLIIIPLYFFYAKANSQMNRWKKVVIKMFREMTFGVYIRFLYEIYIFLVLSSIAEIYQFENLHYIRRLSFFVAVWVATFWVLFMALSINQWAKSWKHENVEEMHYFGEFFKGIKSTRKARSHSLMFLFRRTIFCWIVILINADKYLYPKIWIYAFLQVWYFFYNIIYRPFEYFKDNLWEIVSETIYAILWIYLLFFNHKEHWNSTHELIYLGLIIFNNWFVTVVALGKYRN